MSIVETFEQVGDFDRRLALSAKGVLGQFNAAGVITAADVHIARTLARITREQDESAVLAVAMASRGVRSGSVAIDLTDLAADGASALPDLPWPDPQDWVESVAGSKLVAQGALVVDQGLVYLQRYHHQEVQVVQDLQARAALEPPAVDEAVLAAGLQRIFPGQGYAEQRAAADVAIRAGTSVLTGGPGTGKTTTVAGVLALLAEQAAAAGGRPLRVGLAAPTGKAAARVKAALDGAMAGILARTSDPATRAVVEPLAQVEASTLHRLLGWRPDSRTRFRHHRAYRLPHDVVLVDEASMVSLTHMARLLEALRPTARLILVGDADQLVSVDAGAVLADLVAGASPLASPAAGASSAASPAAGASGPDPVAETALASNPPVAVARLRTVHRFGATIGALAEALRQGDADAVVAALSSGSPEVEWVGDDEPDHTAYLRPVLTRHARAVLDAARRGDGEAALAALGEHRLLCAHRAGPHGVRTWNQLVEVWLGEETGMTFYEPMYLGRPLLVTANDYATGVLNGDTGVVVASQRPDGTPVRMAVIEGPSGAQRFAPSRLGEVETMHAMTIHKAQGSQAREITVLLPESDSALLTRELFYTAVTRAQERVRVVGSEAVVRAAVERRVVRASGLQGRLRALADPPSAESGAADLPPLTG
ncbi:exodeoxyribonuclease V subunit alpha [Ornithinimicrobium pratense]|uniref:RecBCD enzyme subunit RecD n=1 Tax=Ornithinimicrobium pratense TaxID=2593973 RepID=A0A5J6V7I8_9MICO|nr:exodeoxyribonuclease V subunit alpha [Ornithinimicrobium pratense]QFG69809.1 exodeoxyribonuclease V subunit alpha [Ornithinimicrobium pratense]